MDASENMANLDIPIIDLSNKRSRVSELIVKASEEYGFFQVINHGVPNDILSNMEKEGLDFFAKSSLEKQKAGPPDPLGYGIKNIGYNGDTGAVEYLLLHTSSHSLSERSKAISHEPTRFNGVVSGYVQAIRNLACQILNLMAEGLGVVEDTSFLTNLITDVDSDSLLRINRYPCSNGDSNSRIGFGEHSDPQILTVAGSNGVGGLQFSVGNGLWVPVPPDPTAFCINVGDTLQALTNGRFVSARHRVLVDSVKSRMSTIFFATPPLHAWISPHPELITPQNPCLYRPFTWEEYKRTTYSLRLADSRLQLFGAQEVGCDDMSC